MESSGTVGRGPVDRGGETEWLAAGWTRSLRRRSRSYSRATATESAGGRPHAASIWVLAPT